MVQVTDMVAEEKMMLAGSSRQTVRVIIAEDAVEMRTENDEDYEAEQ